MNHANTSTSGMTISLESLREMQRRIETPDPVYQQRKQNDIAIMERARLLPKDMQDEFMRRLRDIWTFRWKMKFDGQTIFGMWEKQAIFDAVYDPGDAATVADQMNF